MTNAHTPGPWTARRMHTGGFDIMDPRNRDVVTVYGGGVEPESREANARLIAAAPDLLSSLIEVVAVADRKTDVFDRARAAIAKATATEQGERG